MTNQILIINLIFVLIIKNISEKYIKSHTKSKIIYIK